MENTQNKESRIGEIIILLLVLVCATLILVDMTINLINEIDGQNQQVVVESTTAPMYGIRPTLSPDYTPEPIHDS